MSACWTRAICYGSINLGPHREQTIAHWCFKLVLSLLRVQLTCEDSPLCTLDPEKEEEASPFCREHGVGTNCHLTLHATSGSVMQRWNHESRFLAQTFTFLTHRRARCFQTLAGVLHFFLDLRQQGLQLLHLLPLLWQVLRVLSLVYQLPQLVCRKSLRMLTWRRTNDGNASRPESPHRACSLSRRWSSWARRWPGCTADWSRGSVLAGSGSQRAGGCLRPGASPAASDTPGSRPGPGCNSLNKEEQQIVKTSALGLKHVSFYINLLSSYLIPQRLRQVSGEPAQPWAGHLWPLSLKEQRQL